LHRGWRRSSGEGTDIDNIFRSVLEQHNDQLRSPSVKSTICGGTRSSSTVKIPGSREGASENFYPNLFDTSLDSAKDGGSRAAGFRQKLGSWAVEDSYTAFEFASSQCYQQVMLEGEEIWNGCGRLYHYVRCLTAKQNRCAISVSANPKESPCKPSSRSPSLEDLHQHQPLKFDEHHTYRNPGAAPFGIPTWMSSSGDNQFKTTILSDISRCHF